MYMESLSGKQEASKKAYENKLAIPFAGILRGVPPQPNAFYFIDTVSLSNIDLFYENIIISYTYFIF